jgi:hypothetical protein
MTPTTYIHIYIYCWFLKVKIKNQNFSDHPSDHPCPFAQFFSAEWEPRYSRPRNPCLALSRAWAPRKDPETSHGFRWMGNKWKIYGISMKIRKIEIYCRCSFDLLKFVDMDFIHHAFPRKSTRFMVDYVNWLGLSPRLGTPFSPRPEKSSCSEFQVIDLAD